MDWFEWLSKSPLNPTLVHQYGLAFAFNELEENDISYFDHPFLQSMGISVAKHRLEILKLVHNHDHNRHRRLVRSVSQLLQNIKLRMGSFIKNLIHPSDEESLSITWRGDVNRKSSTKMERLLPVMAPRRAQASPAVVRRVSSEKRKDNNKNVEDEIIRWDSLFRDLRPT